MCDAFKLSSASMQHEDLNDFLALAEEVQIKGWNAENGWSAKVNGTESKYQDQTLVKYKPRTCPKTDPTIQETKVVRNFDIDSNILQAIDQILDPLELAGLAPEPDL